MVRELASTTNSRIVLCHQCPCLSQPLYFHFYSSVLTSTSIFHLYMSLKFRLNCIDMNRNTKYIQASSLKQSQMNNNDNDEIPEDINAHKQIWGKNALKSFTEEGQHQVKDITPMRMKGDVLYVIPGSMNSDIVAVAGSQELISQLIGNLTKVFSSKIEQYGKQIQPDLVGLEQSKSGYVLPPIQTIWIFSIVSGASDMGDSIISTAI